MTPEEVLRTFAADREAIEREPLPASIGALLDDSVARYGERPFWRSVDDDESLTYAEFGRGVERCAAALAGFGVGRGTHVAVMLPSVPAYVVTWMALAKLGAVMVAVNTHFTGREVAYVLNQSDAEVLVVDHEYLGIVKEIDAGSQPVPRQRMIVHGGPEPGFAHDWRALLEDASPLRTETPRIDPDDLLTIQFTSGSTGVPKGCMLSHRYWTQIGKVRSRQGLWAQNILLDLPFHYMGGQWRLLMALYHGATVFVAPRPSLNRFFDRLVRHRINFCSVTSAAAKLPDDRPIGPLHLRWVLSMGLNKELHQGLEERLGAPVREVYGMTEIGSALTVPVAATHMVGSGSCGLAVAFRECMIADGEGREVAIGQPGELWVSGPGMTQGYYKRPEAFAEVVRGKWFRTGDLFRRDGDGYYYLLGRIKDVIRRSGENIAAAEIETALIEMPEILEVAAIPVPDAFRGEEVKVCVLLRPGLGKDDVTPDQVLAFCRKRLARFKLPRYLEYLDQMPKTASGKIAKQALRPAGKDLREASFDYVDGVWR